MMRFEVNPVAMPVHLMLMSTLICTHGFAETHQSRPKTAFSECHEKQESVIEQLRCLDGVTVKERGALDPKGYQVFDVQIEQPVDHNNPTGPKFQQKLIVHHVSNTAPVVLQTSGYAIFGSTLTEVALQFRANQIQVEHRFFKTSTPNPKDWRYLDIKQSAADFHLITQKFREKYTGKWLNTGASKGGITSILHRYFYPEDLDGTLALVAPLSESTADQRYVDFVEKVGGDKYAGCREKLENFQKALLKSRERILPLVDGDYESLGKKGIAFEHAVYEAPFAFWQYGNPTSSFEGCGSIPSSDASPSVLHRFLSSVNSVEESYSDAGLSRFVPYYVQAANELGSPAVKLSHLEGLAQYPETYRIDSYIPSDAPREFNPHPMQDVQRWVEEESSKIMFIYGEFDPWTAGAYRPGNSERDNYFYVVAGGNHGSSVNRLSATDKKKAWDTLAKWLDAAPRSDSELIKPFKMTPSLEAVEFEARRRRHL